jgi:hypothetical protein
MKFSGIEPKRIFIACADRDAIDCILPDDSNAFARGNRRFASSAI